MYLCQELKPSDLNDVQKSAILQALITNITNKQEDVEAVKLALKALPNAICYANIIFENEGDRDFFMNKLLTAYQVNDEEMQENILHTLREIGEVQYQHLEKYIA